MTKRPLGRGLASLIPTKSAFASGIQDMGSGERRSEVSVERIKTNPHQPRQQFDRESLEGLINSIKVHGIVQPLVVVKVHGGYELIAGERRLRAAKMLELKSVPVVVRTASEQEKLELALVENVQRQNLNPIEKASGYQLLVDEFNLTQEEVARKVGQSRAAVANTLRLLSLSATIQNAISEGELTEGHAKVLLSVTSDRDREKLFKEILNSKLSVRTIEGKVKKSTTKKHARSTIKDPNLVEKEERLQATLGTRVEIVKKGNSGHVMIHFYSGEELQEIINKINSDL